MAERDRRARGLLRPPPGGWAPAGVTFGLLSLLVIGGYALLVSGGTLVLQGVFGWPGVLVSGAAAFCLALALSPLRRGLQKQVNARFFRGQLVQRQLIEDFAQELAQAGDLPAIFEVVQRFVAGPLDPTELQIYMRDGLTLGEPYQPPSGREHTLPLEAGGEFRAVHVGERPASQVRFAAGAPLARLLAARPKAVWVELDRREGAGWEVGLVAEQPRLALLGCPLFVPVAGRSGLAGWLACGLRRSGQPYRKQDLQYLETLAAQAAQAIERAQSMADLERRVREMNVLTRVAQGTNFTLVFDDLLELIYAQTSQVIAAQDMAVWLADQHNGMLYPVFYLENHERLAEKEQNSLPGVIEGLELHIARSQQALLTWDYAAACRDLGYPPGREGVYAWMAAPLIAGGDTVGVISLGCRQAGERFSAAQRNLLQAIGEQVCGAIVKARLMDETEQRARQLALLNEAGRSLTSELELNRLLELSLQSAVEILGCTAGRLWLVDEATGELVAEGVTGALAGGAAGERLPPGAGPAGQAVQTGRPVIANDLAHDKTGGEPGGQAAGFEPHDLLAAPMCVQERVIGVIEVMDKASGLPFTPGDQELLATFSSQATIAIENSRLYTLTDRALAARVAELSVMQRIDHELNASLDLQRAMQITLDWALRQSQADCGLAGVLVEGQVQGVAGGDDATGRLRSSAVVAAAIASGQAQLVRRPAEGAGQAAGAQLALPLKREAAVIGVLLLENARPNGFDAESQAFLERLAEHAAIAVANAQLYNEVQAANLAKSKFVSFVAHELKNPMTVIKGNTELVAKGMAGPVNELQASFLGTVRTNVDRMNTIVSDLNDLTKIQVGSLRLDFKTVAVADSVAEVTRSLARQVEEKNQRLKVEIAQDLPPVWADPVRLNQVITNLVSNAHKYTPAEGEICIGAQLAAPQNGEAGGCVHLWVRDTGIGIPLEDQEKIFQSYFRTEISKDTASGTGLGLYITRSLVSMQRGAIWFESAAGQGSTFHVCMPCAELG